MGYDSLSWSLTQYVGCRSLRLSQISHSGTKQRCTNSTLHAFSATKHQEDEMNNTIFSELRSKDDVNTSHRKK